MTALGAVREPRKSEWANELVYVNKGVNTKGTQQGLQQARLPVSLPVLVLVLLLMIHTEGDPLRLG